MAAICDFSRHARAIALFGALTVVRGFVACAMGSDVAPNAIVQVTRNTESLRIPRISRAPILEEFLDMQAPAAWEGKLAKVNGFVQRSPDNGRAATEATDVFVLPMIAHPASRFRLRMFRRASMHTLTCFA